MREQRTTQELQAQLVAAAARLLAGDALHCDGKLTLSNLAREADIPWTYRSRNGYRHFFDQFKLDIERLTATGSATRDPLQQEVERLQDEVDRIGDAKQTEARARQDAEALQAALASQVEYLRNENRVLKEQLARGTAADLIVRPIEGGRSRS